MNIVSSKSGEGSVIFRLIINEVYFLLCASARSLLPVCTVSLCNDTVSWYGVFVSVQHTRKKQS